MPVQDAAGFPTYRTSLGQAPRRALAIHCALAHSGAWAPLAAQMDQELAITAFDMPGHGHSADWGQRGDYQDVVTQIAATILDAPMDVIGHSFGATVALRLAVAYPDKVRTLTLIEPVLFAAAERGHPKEFAAHKRQAQPFEDALVAGDRTMAAKMFTEHWGDGRAWRDLTQANREALTARIHLIGATDSAVYGDRAGLLQQGVLDAVKMPCLLVQGSESPAIVTLINTELVRRLPGSRNVVVEGGGAHGANHTPRTGCNGAAGAIFARILTVKNIKELINLDVRDGPVTDQSDGQKFVRWAGVQRPKLHRKRSAPIAKSL